MGSSVAASSSHCFCGMMDGSCVGANCFNATAKETSSRSNSPELLVFSKTRSRLNCKLYSHARLSCEEAAQTLSMNRFVHASKPGAIGGFLNLINGCSLTRRSNKKSNSLSQAFAEVVNPAVGAEKSPRTGMAYKTAAQDFVREADNTR